MLKQNQNYIVFVYGNHHQSCFTVLYIQNYNKHATMHTIPLCIVLSLAKLETYGPKASEILSFQDEFQTHDNNKLTAKSLKLCIWLSERSE